MMMRRAVNCRGLIGSQWPPKMEVSYLLDAAMSVSTGVAALLSADNLAFIQKGISISVASRDVRQVPSLSRALACRLSDDGSQLRIAVARSQSADLLRDLEKCRAIAVVFTEPSTHRTLQIKGRDATIGPMQPADQQAVASSAAAFAADILPLGFDQEFTARLFALEPDDGVVVSFTPETVFEQTPGPHAGAPLEQPV